MLVTDVSSRYRQLSEPAANPARIRRIGELTAQAPVFDKSEAVSNVVEYFKKHRDVKGAVVLSGTTPVGTILSDSLFQQLASPYGISLYWKRPIGLLMEQHPLIVDMQTPLEEVSQLALAREVSNLYSFVIIMDNTRVWGIATLRAIIDAMQVMRTQSLEAMNEELSQTLVKLRETQASLVLSEKLASLGSIVAGVAHEVNTPVGISVTATSFLSQSTKELLEQYADNSLTQESFDDYLEIVQESVPLIMSNLLRASDLIRSFKQVSIDQTLEEARLFRLSEYFQHISNSLKPELKKTHLRVQLHIDEGLEVYSYPGAFYQIINNFVMNSIVHAYSAHEPGVLRIEAVSENEEIVLRYSDDGRGIDAKLKDAIFEPFVTTKRGQGGTGLGLHIVRNIVHKQLNGTVTCNSALGQGSEFTIRFPWNKERTITGK